MAKDTIFRQKFLDQWIRSVEKPQFHHDLGDFVSGHFLPKKPKNGLKRPKNTIFYKNFSKFWIFLKKLKNFEKKKFLKKKNFFFQGSKGVPLLLENSWFFSGTQNLKDLHRMTSQIWNCVFQMNVYHYFRSA